MGLQRGSVLPVGQLLPGAVEMTVAISRWALVSGLLTVNDPVRVTVPPTGMSPVQTAPVALTDKVPEVAVSSPSLVPSFPRVPPAVRVMP